MKKNINQQFVIGVDFGGTNMVVTVCDVNGNVVSHIKEKTLRWESKDSIIKRMKILIDKAIISTNFDITEFIGIGIGACGLVNYNSGHFITSPIFPDWKEIPLSKEISDEFQLPVILDNDANAASFGEWWVGAGKGLRDIICLTLGTGIGGGIILNGKLYRGANYNGGELGHMTVEPEGTKCFCGNRGCLSLLAGATGMKERFMKKIKVGRESKIVSLVEGDFTKITAKLIYKASKEDDILAKEVIDETTRYLGIGIANLLNIFNPEMIVLVGGLTNMGNDLLAPIYKEAEARTFPVIYNFAKIAIGKLGDKAGSIGAAGILKFALLKEKQI
ncbi:MAG: ROK family protein [bacterium]|nr:ROK family protein [bacterium]